MAKWANDLVMDQGLEYLKYHANNLVACAGQPTNYAEAIGANFLGMITLSIGHLNVSDGVISGRRLTVSGRMGLLTQVAGLADHFALIDSVNQVYFTLPKRPVRSRLTPKTVSTPLIGTSPSLTRFSIVLDRPPTALGPADEVLVGPTGQASL